MSLPIFFGMALGWPMGSAHGALINQFIAVRCSEPAGYLFKKACIGEVTGNKDDVFVTLKPMAPGDTVRVYRVNYGKRRPTDDKNDTATLDFVGYLNGNGGVEFIGVAKHFAISEGSGNGQGRFRLPIQPMPKQPKIAVSIWLEGGMVKLIFAPQAGLSCSQFLDVAVINKLAR